ncbi:MAG: hypothetical protein JNL61_07155 [Rhizobiaceae bacterium]|nr:hypothetical protein [Rhizobiaceae bacterium]
MTSIDAGKTDLSRDRRRSDLRAVRLLFCCAYPFCLAIAIFERFVRKPRGEIASYRPTRSVFAEARASAASIIPFAFR